VKLEPGINGTASRPFYRKVPSRGTNPANLAGSSIKLRSEFTAVSAISSIGMHETTERAGLT